MAKGIHEQELGIERQDYFKRYRNLEDKLDQIVISLKKIEVHLSEGSGMELKNLDVGE